MFTLCVKIYVKEKASTVQNFIYKVLYKEYQIINIANVVNYDNLKMALDSLQLFLSRGKSYFSPPGIWAGIMTGNLKNTVYM